MIEFARLKDITTPVENGDIKEQYLSNLRTTFVPSQELFSRFSSIIPHNLKSAKIAIIGIGGIGFCLLRQLTKIGLSNVHVFDFDVVDAHNVGPQGFSWHQINEKKVKAVEDRVFEDTGISIFTYDMKIENYQDIIIKCGTPDILCICVDNMELRKELANTVIDMSANLTLEQTPEFYIDARMALGTWSIYTFPIKLASNKPYLFDQILGEDEKFNNSILKKAFKYFFKEGIFTDEQGVQEPCTAREINFTGEAISAKIVSSILYLYNQNTKLYSVSDAHNFEKVESFFDLQCNKTSHKWLHSFDTLNWKELLPTPINRSYEHTINNYKTLLGVTLQHLLNLHTKLSEVTLTSDAKWKELDAIATILNEDNTVVMDKVLDSVRTTLNQVFLDGSILDTITRLRQSISSSESIEEEGIIPPPTSCMEDLTVLTGEELAATLQPPLHVGDFIKFKVDGGNLTPWREITGFEIDTEELYIILESERAYKYKDIDIKYINPAHLLGT